MDISDQLLPNQLPRRRFLQTAGAAAAAALTCGAWPLSAQELPDGKIHQVHVPLKTPKSGKDNRAGEALDTAPFSAFVPAGEKIIRGAVVNPFYEETVNQSHWRAAVMHWDFALLGANLFGVKGDEMGETVLKGLSMLAESAGRSEIANLPLCPVGMSAGGGMSVRIAEALSDRVIAAGPVCLEVGPRDEASARIPMITVFGERDGSQMEKLLARLPEHRRQWSARWAIAPQWGRKHEFHLANNIVMPLFDRAIALRYPDDASPAEGAVKLRELPVKSGWLGDPETWKEPLPRVAPFDEFDGERSSACWLADGYLAAVWQAFVTPNPPLSIVSPSPLGGGNPFTLHSAGRLAVEVRIAGDLAATRIEIFDGDQQVAEADGGGLAVIDRLQPGIHALIAAAETADGRIVSHPNTIVVTSA